MLSNSAIAIITVLDKLEGNDFPTVDESLDTICFGGNTNLASITPVTGGLASDHRYKWEASTTSFTGPWIAAGSTSEVYDPDALGILPVGNHFYRRIVFSGTLDACKDTSNATARKVWPVIDNNLIKADQTIGYNTIPLKLTETSGSPTGGDGLKYKYQWVKVTPPPEELAPVGPAGNTGNEYQPLSQTGNVSFKRIVSSSACSSSSNSVNITVDPEIVNTVITGKYCT